MNKHYNQVCSLIAIIKERLVDADKEVNASLKLDASFNTNDSINYIIMLNEQLLMLCIQRNEMSHKHVAGLIQDALNSINQCRARLLVETTKEDTDLLEQLETTLKSLNEDRRVNDQRMIGIN